MKKLMIILLIGMLSLGLSGVAFADDQEISAKITGSVALGVPTALSGWVLTFAAGGGATQNNSTYDDTAPSAADPHAAKIDANCPYNLKVKFSATDFPVGDTADDKMSCQNTTSAAITDLAQVFQLAYYLTGSAVTSTSSTETLWDITSTSQTLVSAGTPDDGIDIVGIQFGQRTTIDDPAYNGSTQLNYQIQLTWTASVSI